MTETITVTQADIDQAKKIRSERLQGVSSSSLMRTCPIALAGQRALSAVVVIATEQTLCWGKAYRTEHEAKLPRAAYDFILNFDAFVPVEPFTFEVEWSD